MEEFNSLLQESFNTLERFVKYKINNSFDAEDIIQETCYTAYRKFSTLKNKDSFKAWIIGIARNKCNDYFTAKAKCLTIPLEALHESAVPRNRSGKADFPLVQETFDKLMSKEKQVLFLYFWKDLQQEEIAKRLHIPLGTVKSRLYYAKKHFREQYTKSSPQKGKNDMRKFPEYLPEYKIMPSKEIPFPVVFEEIPGWFIVPKTGNEASWASYDLPKKNLTETTYLKVGSAISLHGITGVEIHSSGQYFDTDWDDKSSDHIYYAQLTDTHCRWLGESYKDKDGIRNIRTFLDGDAFIDDWGLGEENFGFKTHLRQTGDIVRNGFTLITPNKEWLSDIVGRYTVNINGKIYDTVCLVCIFKYGVLTEQYIDKSGRSILWRRFNIDDWAHKRYQKNWSEILPDSEKLTVNGETYVHWYDCISDYIL